MPKYTIPADPKDFAKDLNHVCAKLFDDSDLSFDRKMSLTGRKQFQATLEEISLMVLSDLADEFDTEKINEKLIYYCQVVEELAKDKNYFPIKAILTPLRNYAYEIRKRTISELKQDESNPTKYVQTSKMINIGKYNEIYESINAAFKSLENHNPHMKVGLHPHVYQEQGLMLPFTSRTFSRLDRLQEEYNNCKDDLEDINLTDVETKKLKIKLHKNAKNYIKAAHNAFEIIDECSQEMFKQYIIPSPDPNRDSLYKQFKQANYELSHSLHEEKKAYLHDISRHSIVNHESGRKSVSSKYTANNTLKTIKQIFQRTEQTYDQEAVFPEDKVKQVQPITSSASKYIAHILKRIDDEIYAQQEDLVADNMVKFIKQIMEDYNYDVDDDPQKFLDMFDNYAKVNLLYYDEEQDIIQDNAWMIALSKLKREAKKQFHDFDPEITAQDLKDHPSYVVARILSSYPKMKLLNLKNNDEIKRCFLDDTQFNMFLESISKIQEKLLLSEYEDIDSLLSNIQDDEELNQAAENIIDVFDDKIFINRKFTNQLFELEFESQALKYIEYILDNIKLENDIDGISLFAESSPEIDFKHYLLNMVNNDGLSLEDEPSVFLQKILVHANSNDPYDNTGDEGDYNLDKWSHALKRLKSTLIKYETNPTISPVMIQRQQKIEYSQLILESIKNKTSLEQLPIHNKMKKIFQKIIENESLTEDSEPIEFVELIEDQFKSLDPNDGEYDQWSEYVEQLYKGYLDITKPPSKKALLSGTIRNSSITQSTPVTSSYQTLATRPSFVGVTTTIDIDTQQIKQKFIEAVKTLHDENLIEGYTRVQNGTLPNGDSCFQSKIETLENEQVDLKMSTNGKSAYIGSKYSMEKYKLLVKVFIETNDVTDPNQVRGVNVPDGKEQEVNQIIRESIEEYLDNKNDFNPSVTM